MKKNVAIIWAGIMPFFVILTVIGQVAQRTYTVADCLSREFIREVAISPDHAMLAYVHQRPVESVTRLGFEYRGEVWIASSTGKANPTRVTPSDDESTYARPTWSADGSKLAMLYGGRGRVWHVAIWDNKTHQFTRLSPDKVAATEVYRDRMLVWAGNDRLIVSVADKADTDDDEGLAAVPIQAYRRALAALAGKQPTSRVFDSGVSSDLSAHPHDRLVVLGVDGSVQPIASAYDIGQVNISPDVNYVAYMAPRALRRVDGTTKEDKDWIYYGRQYIYRLNIVDLRGRSIPLHTDMIEAVRPDSFAWSPDSKAFAFAALKSETLTPGIFRGTIDGQIINQQLGGGVIPQSFRWTRDGLIVLAEDAKSGTTRRDWWLIDAGGNQQNVSASMKSVPGDLSAVADGRFMVGVNSGELWRFDPQTTQWRNLTESFAPRVNRLWIGPAPSGAAFSDNTQVLISADENSGTAFYRLNVDSGAVSEIPRPSQRAEPVAYDGKADTAIFQAYEDTGTFLTIYRDSAIRPVVGVNEYLAKITGAQAKQVTYLGHDGQTLKGWLLLPPGYKEGKRYPLVTWVYAGHIMTEKPAENTGVNDSYPYVGAPQLELFAARGYAVLVPSMPLPLGPADVYLELTKGVLPAVDKAIDLGIADPKRLAVAGLSGGGYSTFGLITQTTRFKAAIAISGFSDLISNYGIFNQYVRYSSESRFQDVPDPQGMTWSEQANGSSGLDGPPWKDPARYLRNSPLFYADKVQTPVLIVHGDMDAAVASEQSEEFFIAMRRQGKRARYLQYAGEEHFLHSRANVRDFWNQAYAWLDEFCDISRDNNGQLVFDGDSVKSRNGGSPLKPADFARFDAL